MKQPPKAKPLTPAQAAEKKRLIDINKARAKEQLQKIKASLKPKSKP